MPLVEIIHNSPNNLDEIYKQFPEVKKIPKDIIDDVKNSGLTFNFGKAGNKIYIASYEGHEGIVSNKQDKSIVSNKQDEDIVSNKQDEDIVSNKQDEDIVSNKQD